MSQTLPLLRALMQQRTNKAVEINRCRPIEPHQALTWGHPFEGVHFHSHIPGNCSQLIIEEGVGSECTAHWAVYICITKEFCWQQQHQAFCHGCLAAAVSLQAMLREVSDLSFGSFSEDEEPAAASSCLASLHSKPYRGTHDGSWKTYTNNLEDGAGVADIDTEEQAQESEVSGTELSSSKGQVRFNTVFESDQDRGEQEEELDLPTTWSACDPAELGLIAAHLAAAALPPIQQAANHSRAASQDSAALLMQVPLEAEDMLGFGTLDLRSCTLNRQAPNLTATSRFPIESSFSGAAQVHRQTSIGVCMPWFMPLLHTVAAEMLALVFADG